LKQKALDKCKGLKEQKHRLTLLLAVSQYGVWIKLLIIGKANRPLVFKQLDVSELPFV
jgi:hypothetical protein